MNEEKDPPEPRTEDWHGRGEVRYHGDELDEVVARCVDFHLERMSDGAFWIGLSGPDGLALNINLYTRRGALILGHAEDDSSRPLPGGTPWMELAEAIVDWVDEPEEGDDGPSHKLTFLADRLRPVVAWARKNR